MARKVYPDECPAFEVVEACACDCPEHAVGNVLTLAPRDDGYLEGDRSGGFAASQVRPLTHSAIAMLELVRP